MTLEELKSCDQINIFINKQKMPADIVTAPETGKVYFRLQGSGLFSDLGTMQVEITPDLATYITAQPDGIPLLAY